MQKEELLSKVRQGYDDFTAYIHTLEPTEVTVLTDAAGWTIKDHMMHLVVWEDGMWALLNRQPRYQQMGVTLEYWLNDDYDAMNAEIQQRYRYLSMGEVMRRFDAVHQRLMETIAAIPESDLNQPYDYFMPEGVVTGQEYPIHEYISGNTFDHYEEHRPWIEAIRRPEFVTDRETLLSRMRKAWDYLQGYIATVDETDVTEPTDAAGWTPKDHVIHLSLWEGGVAALLNKEDRRAFMGVDEATWEADDYDQINAVMQRQNRDLAWEEVKRRLADAHQRLISKVEALTQDDVLRPYGYYLPAGQEDNEGAPVINYVAGNTFAHYPEHIEWMDAIIHGD